MRLHAIDEANRADDAAVLKRGGVQRDAELVGDGAKLFTLGVILPGMDVELAAKGCRPGSILNVFDALNYQGRPGLTDGKDFDHGSFITGLVFMVNNGLTAG